MLAEQTSSNPLLIILGATASGKTRLAVSLASSMGAEIISGDSRQVFKGMDIGTGKDLSEYTYKGQMVPYHLIDIKQPGEKYHVDEFKEDFFEVFQDLSSRKVLPILCGGSGMYIHSILQNHAYTSIPVDESLRTTLTGKTLIELNNILSGFPAGLTSYADRSTIKRLIRAIEIASFLIHHKFEPAKRPNFKPYVVGLANDVEIRRQKIGERLDRRLAQGMVEEVQGLMYNGIHADVLTSYGLEYKIIVSYLQQKVTFNTMKEQLFNGICQYAKRQMTFFRKMEKDGVNIHWYQADIETEMLQKTIKSDLKHYFSSF